MPSVLVVDDSLVMHRLLRDAITEDGVFEVQTAISGANALSLIGQAVPDLVILDIEMPDIDGIETLRRIRKVNASLPVVMFSSRTERGAEATIDSLMLGASDYATKPSNDRGVAGALEAIRQQLMPKVRALTGRAKPPVTAAVTVSDRHLLQPGQDLKSCRGRVEVVAIGSSTGGPNALAEVVPLLRNDLGVPVVIVQHMPPVFTRFLAERLNASSPLTVHEAQGGEKLQAGQVWIAPGDFHMIVKKSGPNSYLELHQGPQENSCRPSVDVLFRSVNIAFPGSALGIILTGMGQDGLLGATQMAASGSVVLAQDEATSVVWGMPGFVARAGLADKVLPISEIAPEITSRVGRANSYATSDREVRSGR